VNHPGGAGGPGDLIRSIRSRTLEGRDQRGLSLAEVLVTLAIISILFVAVAAGLTTSVKAGAATDQQQRLQAKLTSFTEGLRSLQASYVACDPANAQAASPAAWELAYDTAHDAPAPLPTALQARSDLAATVAGVRYWNGSTFVGSCSSNDGGSQLLTVTVTDGDQSITGDVVVRRQ